MSCLQPTNASNMRMVFTKQSTRTSDVRFKVNTEPTQKHTNLRATLQKTTVVKCNFLINEFVSTLSFFSNQKALLSSAKGAHIQCHILLIIYF